MKAYDAVVKRLKDQMDDDEDDEYAQRRHDPMTFESLVQSTVLAQDVSKYFALRNDIVEHLWSNHGDQ